MNSESSCSSTSSSPVGRSFGTGGVIPARASISDRRMLSKSSVVNSPFKSIFTVSAMPVSSVGGVGGLRAYTGGRPQLEQDGHDFAGADASAPGAQRGEGDVHGPRASDGLVLGHVADIMEAEDSLSVRDGDHKMTEAIGHGSRGAALDLYRDTGERFIFGLIADGAFDGDALRKQRGGQEQGKEKKKEPWQSVRRVHDLFLIWQIKSRYDEHAGLAAWLMRS